MNVRSGDCYQAAASAIVRGGLPRGTTLVHGTVTGRRGELRGRRFGHAWLEYQRDLDGRLHWLCLDVTNGHEIELPRGAYYAIGKIDPEEVTRYDRDATLKALLDHEHFGPWEPHRLNDPPQKTP